MIRRRAQKLIGGIIVILVAGAAIFIYLNIRECPSPEWGAKLREALTDCDRLRVRSDGLGHRRENEEKLLFEIIGAEAVGEVVRHIDINTKESRFSCACWGNPTFEFYHGQKLVAEVSYHHGIMLRWVGWKNDGLLTDSSAQYLKNLMVQNGLNPDDYR